MKVTWAKGWAVNSVFMVICHYRLWSYFISKTFQRLLSVLPIMGQIISMQSNASSNRSGTVWMVCVTQVSLPQRHCCGYGVLSADRNTQSVTEWRFAPSTSQQDAECHTAFPASQLGFHLAQGICTAHFLLRESRGSASPSSFLIFFLLKFPYTVYNIVWKKWKENKPEKNN